MSARVTSPLSFKLGPSGIQYNNGRMFLVLVPRNMLKNYLKKKNIKKSFWHTNRCTVVINVGKHNGKLSPQKFERNADSSGSRRIRWTVHTSRGELLLATQHGAHCTSVTPLRACRRCRRSTHVEWLPNEPVWRGGGGPGLWTVLETNYAAEWESSCCDGDDNLRKPSTSSPTLMETSLGFLCNTSWKRV